ncbi:MAG: tryptophan synthase subunit alpha [Planctomycetota bacterium]|nr:tryptophan synthase subunit alpha [Planctomycetota bacterium]MDA0919010.1 tryptophan synthase subunit alpha [Planctomycetota bacterium]MDA1160444.1 tryptophan synthase subunit alpha [Planctomycetota bacterium]
MTEQTRIASTFGALKEAGHLAFMPFITAGDPDMAATLSVIRELGDRGVDLIEVGFPYSDPIADGPVIQASYTRALDKGLHVNDIFDGVRSLPTEELPPLVAMASYALLFRRSVEEFVKQAVESGFAGFIIPDLPADEAADVGKVVQSHGADLIQLISPMTPKDRATEILKAASGFVYCISVAGTTGVRDDLPPELTEQLNWLRTQTDVPLAVGFGIKGPEQVDILRDAADGVIVGSAIVRMMAGLGTSPEGDATALAEIGTFAESMVQATRKK